MSASFFSTPDQRASFAEGLAQAIAILTGRRADLRSRIVKAAPKICAIELAGAPPAILARLQSVQRRLGFDLSSFGIEPASWEEVVKLSSSQLELAAMAKIVFDLVEIEAQLHGHVYQPEEKAWRVKTLAEREQMYLSPSVASQE